MNILVVGNGFDLAHGLPTKYSDFLEFVQAFQLFTNGKDVEKPYDDFFIRLKEGETSIYNEIHNLVSDNCWIRYFIGIYKNRQREGKNGWIDFESEISIIIQTLDEARKTLLVDFKKGEKRAHMEQWQLIILGPLLNKDGKVPNTRSIEFDNTAINYRKNQLINDLNKLTRCLEIYLYKYISYENCNRYKDITDLKIDKVLSFNYTNTYKMLYDLDPNSTIEYDFIHGQIKDNSNIDECNMVLGIDEYLIGTAKDNDNEFIQFKKFYQRIYKGTGYRCSDWINYRQESIRQMPKLPPPELNIYVYGHSLDVTDADILRKLIMAEGAKTFIFFHSKETMGKQIANLVKILGEEELIKRTDGSNRTIVFKRTSTMKA